MGRPSLDGVHGRRLALIRDLAHVLATSGFAADHPIMKCLALDMHISRGERYFTVEEAERALRRVLIPGASRVGQRHTAETKQKIRAARRKPNGSREP